MDPRGTLADLQGLPEDPQGPADARWCARDRLGTPKDRLRGSIHALASAQPTPEPEHFARIFSHRHPRASTYVRAGAISTPEAEHFIKKEASAISDPEPFRMAVKDWSRNSRAPKRPNRAPRTASAPQRPLEGFSGRSGECQNNT